MGELGEALVQLVVVLGTVLRELFGLAVRNALVLVITIVGLQFGSLMGQAVVVEKLFAWPGVGSLMVDSVFQRDMPAVQGCILMIVLFFLLINTLVDLAYVVIDPRIRYG